MSSDNKALSQTCNADDAAATQALANEAEDLESREAEETDDYWDDTGGAWGDYKNGTGF